MRYSEPGFFPLDGKHYNKVPCDKTDYNFAAECGQYAPCQHPPEPPMPREHKPRQSSTRTLVTRLLDNPRLPAYVASLATPVLQRLIHHVGKEDAQELMHFASPQQIRDLVEADVWQSEQPGTEEQFDPARFLEWLALWDDMSPAFLTEKLKSLGSELLALTLDAYVVVVDLNEVGVMGGDVDVFHEFGVMPRDTEEWPPVYRLLADVWNEDQEFLEEALARCCQRRSLRTEKTHIASNEFLQQDMAGARERHRQDQGFVTPETAAQVLTQMRSSSLDSLLIEVRYELLTGLQLQAQRRRQQLAGARAWTGDRSTDVQDGVDGSPADSNWRELDSLLMEAQIINPSPANKLLASPDLLEELFLKQQLRQLADTTTAALDDRLNEIVHLGNVLMAGCSRQGRRFTESEAADCVYATCNLGLRYCLELEPWDDEQTMLREFLEQEPGLIKAFRIGFHLLSQLPEKVIRALERDLQSTKIQKHLRSHPWILERIKQEFVVHKLGLKQGIDRLARVRALIDALAMACDSNTCEQLRLLCDTMPCLPRSLEGDTEFSLHVDRRGRFIRAPDDLRRATDFLAQLPQRLV